MIARTCRVCGEFSNGLTCRRCARWDGLACEHPRHANDDPSRPCALRRYRNDDGAPRTWKACKMCGQVKPPEQFAVYTSHGIVRRRGRCKACDSARKRAA